MAKAQKRGNREAKKPKQAKPAPKPEGTFARQLRADENTSGPGKRKS
jgi:hypothetical protein